MKRSIGILVIIIAEVFVGLVYAGTKYEVKGQVNGIYYIFDKFNANASVTYKGSEKNACKANTYSGDVTIPALVIYKDEKYTVTAIGQNAFCGCADLTSIKLPPTLKYISHSSFEGCTGLSEIILPESVIKIGLSAFSNCKFSKIHFPESLKEIGSYAFRNCSELRDVYSYKAKGLQTIGQYAFAGCTNLQAFVLPSDLKRIEDGTFRDCKNLSGITILPKITYIGDRAFAGCENLSKLIFLQGEELLEIESCAFRGCRSLELLLFPKRLKCIGAGAFDGCSSLKGVRFAKGCTLANSLCLATFTKIDNLAEIQYDEGFDLSIVPFELKAKCVDVSKRNNVSPSNLPLLTVESGSVSFTDASGNNRIDAAEQCSVQFVIKNSGKGDATNCEARVALRGSKDGISVEKVKLPVIQAGKTVDVSIPIISNINTQNGNVIISIEIYEPNGFGIAPFDLTVATKAYEEPLLQVVDYNIASASGKVKQMEPFVLRFNLQNTKYGTAEDVRIRLNLPTGVFVMDDAKERTFKQVKSGEAILVQYNLIANNNYSDTNIPITIDVKEKHGRFAENKRLDIALNQTASSSINIAAKDEPQEERKEIQKAMLTSEVDRNIPVTGAKNPNTFVLIIANEHYLQVAGVPYALNDGNIFREYCIKTLGISEKHIKYFADATGNQIKSGVNWLANLTEVFDNPQIIVYYAGHGVPDEASKSAYLLPVDGNGSDISTGYKLDDLYATLGNMPAAQITVFMDACFSGSKRQQGMLASARGVALKVKAGTPQGNMVVFSAATGDETAYPNNEQQHGLFTYYLLKKLQETKGDVALKDLGEYITKQVSQQSLIINDRRQTPTVTPSAAVGAEWQNWKLK